ncbi:MAG: hypothetical protein BWX71_02262 [Deltaproteobacteria bacterium ADurb.Bin072]|nr:MAG: hypothetical protein BWX71_02262 [Deltaproteobacteria bacterium ADurb.Bin072]
MFHPLHLVTVHTVEGVGEEEHGRMAPADDPGTERVGDAVPGRDVHAGPAGVRDLLDGNDGAHVLEPTSLAYVRELAQCLLGSLEKPRLHVRGHGHEPRPPGLIEVLHHGAERVALEGQLLFGVCRVIDHGHLKPPKVVGLGRHGIVDVLGHGRSYHPVDHHRGEIDVLGHVD